MTEFDKESPSEGGPESLDPRVKAKLEGLANDFQSIIERGSEGDRFEYLKGTMVMLMHKVQELEKTNRWANRRIEELQERLTKLEAKASDA